MLALFRNNHSTTVFVLAIYIALLRLPAMLGWISPPAEIPETDGGLLFWDIFGGILHHPQYSAIAATGLVIFQAFSINLLVDRFRLLDNRNWYPGAFFGLAASLLPEFLFVNPALVAATFIPFALGNIFNIYKQITVFGPAFDSAFWVSVAVLFFPPAMWLFPAAYFGLINLRALSLEKQFVFLSGIIVPFFLAFAGYFWFDKAAIFWQTQFTQLVHLPNISFTSGLYTNLKIAITGLLILVTILGFNIYYHHRLIQVQKYITCLYWFMFAAIIAAVFQVKIQFEYFLLAMPSIGIFLAYLGQSIRNTGLADLLNLLLIASMYFIQFFPKIN